MNIIDFEKSQKHFFESNGVKIIIILIIYSQLALPALLISGQGAITDKEIINYSRSFFM